MRVVTETEASPRPAATVVLLRPGPDGPEVLLTRRPSTMAFAADMHVFPGGAVDPADADSRLAARCVITPRDAQIALGGDLAAPAALARYVAALRELFEEAGVLLAEPALDAATAKSAREGLLGGRSTLTDLAEALDLRLQTDLLAPIGHWTTPPIMARRFDTRFFVAELPDGVETTFGTDEIVGHRWETPRAALDAMAAGDIAMWVPTSATLQQLEHVSGLAEIRARIVPEAAAAPRVVAERPGITRVVVSGAGGVPGQSENTYLVGRRRLVLVDPGDPSDEAATAVLGAAAAAASDGEIVAVALTHVDPDHAAGAEGLALRLNVPIYAGPGGGRPLPYAVVELADGDRITEGDIGLEAIATPGARPDHVAYAVAGHEADGSESVLTGDLLGPRADKAVLGPVDEAARAASIDRLAARRPGRVFPGHGEPQSLNGFGVSGGVTPPGSGGS
jgi:glyoxylase-like metal-dependent hydrolase (beta-lactamase superfamily II)/8-oxo-dGTP pyrophosphatase MutT (NUDIX family)